MSRLTELCSNQEAVALGVHHAGVGGGWMLILGPRYWGKAALAEQIVTDAGLRLFELDAAELVRDRGAGARAASLGSTDFPGVTEAHEAGIVLRGSSRLSGDQTNRLFRRFFERPPSLRCVLLSDMCECETLGRAYAMARTHQCVVPPYSQKELQSLTLSKGWRSAECDAIYAMIRGNRGAWWHIEKCGFEVPKARYLRSPTGWLQNMWNAFSVDVEGYPLDERQKALAGYPSAINGLLKSWAVEDYPFLQHWFRLLAEP